MAKYKHASQSRNHSRDSSSLRKRPGRKPDDLFVELDDEVEFDSYVAQLARIE